MVDRQKIKKIFLIAFITAVITGLAASIRVVIWVVQVTPDISDYGNWEPAESTIVYADNGEVLTKFYKENRTYVSLERIPKELQQAAIAIEDTRFREHCGIDPVAISRALWVDLKHMAKVQGASTITQQLARNVLLTNKKLFSRKLKEMYLAFQFERMYTKDEILEFYLNEIFMGHGIYGVQNAAKFYFNKSIEELTLSQSALLAGLIRAPNYYSPYRHLKEAKERRNIVLTKMAEQGYITKEQAKQVKKAPIKLKHSPQEETKLASYFIRYVRKKLLNKFGAKQLYTEGLRVYTTLDLSLQKKAQRVISSAIERGDLPTVKKRVGYGEKQPQLALVTLDSATGQIKAMIGGRGSDKFNRAVQAHRQVGSAFKPFVYTTAVKQGMSPGSVIDDSLKKYKMSRRGKQMWIPENYNGKYLGPTTLRIGLAKSINVMAVKLLAKVGVDRAIKLAGKMGLKGLVKKDRNLAIALGGLTKGATPLQMAEAYGVYANQGIKTPSLAITKVYDRFGNLIWNNAANKETKKQIILNRPVDYLITDMLQSAMARGPLVWGTGWRANIGRPAAGKTGTTSNYTDAWFVGYTPDLVTSIWIGEDQPSRMEYPLRNEQGTIIKDETGKARTEIISSGEAAKLWGNYMEQAVKNSPLKHFKRPDKVITKEICVESGQVPNQYCRQEGTVREELFIKGTEPAKTCLIHKKTDRVQIDTGSWKLATSFCPPNNVATKRYQVKTGIIVDKHGVPVKKHHQQGRLKLPVRNQQGEFVYQKKPNKKCSQHLPQNILQQKVIDIFNIK